MAAKTTFSLEDVIADEVRKATAAAAPAAVPVGAGIPDGGGNNDLLGNINLKEITGLIKEINIMLASREKTPAAAPVAGTGPAPAGLPGVDCTPAQNPRPGPAAVCTNPAPVCTIEPEKVYNLVLSSIEQIKGAIGDAKLSEVAEFMTGNKAVVVALIGQEVNKL